MRKILSSEKGNDYKNYQQCWASFKCDAELDVYWKLVKFVTEPIDVVIFFGVNNSAKKTFSGYSSDTEDWELEKWYTLNDNHVTFEFKSDISARYSGFEIFLICQNSK